VGSAGFPKSWKMNGAKQVKEQLSSFYTASCLPISFLFFFISIGSESLYFLFLLCKTRIYQYEKIAEDIENGMIENNF
jgi:hypothetical protein